MGIILLYLLVEILPMLFVLDHRFVAFVGEASEKSPAIEPLYELQYMRESASYVSNSNVLLSADRGAIINDSYVNPNHMFTPVTHNFED